MAPDHEELKGLLAPYVLGATSREEEALVRSHLRSCEECSREAERFAPATSALTLAVDPVPLPDGFAERTLARARDERPAPQPSTARRRSFAWAFSTAAAVVIAAFGWVAIGGDAVDRDEVVALLDRPGVSLEGDGARAKIVATDEGTKFVAEGLAAPPEGQVYELWKMDASCAPGRHGPCIAKPAGTFEPADGLVIEDLETDIQDFEEAAVTVEDELVDQPTGEPVLTSF